MCMGFLASIMGRKTHKLVQDALVILDNLTHRGATGFDPLLGDGSWHIASDSHKFFREVFSLELPEPSRYGVGMFFLPQEVNLERELRALAEKLVAVEGQKTIGWREVPVNTSGLSKAVIRLSPKIFQLFVEADAELENDLEFEKRKLYLIRSRSKILSEIVLAIKTRVRMLPLFLVEPLCIKEWFSSPSGRIL